MRFINLFNESFYLNENEYKKRLIKNLYEKETYIFNYERQKENYDNSSLITLYKDFLLETKNLIDLLHITNNDLEYAIVLEYLIHNGYLSYNQKFYPTSNNIDLRYNLGINVITGNAVCRHISKFYSDIIDNKNNYPTEYRCQYDKNRNSFSSKFSLGNHIINLVFYKDVLYGIDLLNKKIFSFINGIEMQTLDHDTPLYLRYKPFFDIINGAIDVENVRDNISLFKYYARCASLTYEEAYDIKKRIYSLLEEKKDLLNSFDNETSALKDEINKKMLLKTK